jgi:hypothetical protein
LSSDVIPIYDSTRNLKTERKEPRPGFILGRPVYETRTPVRNGKKWQGLRGWVVLVVTLEELFVAAVDRHLTADFDVLRIINESFYHEFEKLCIVIAHCNSILYFRKNQIALSQIPI